VTRHILHKLRHCDTGRLVNEELPVSPIGRFLQRGIVTKSAAAASRPVRVSIFVFGWIEELVCAVVIVTRAISPSEILRAAAIDSATKRVFAGRLFFDCAAPIFEFRYPESSN
jgi:hypothetical protein